MRIYNYGWGVAFCQDLEWAKIVQKGNRHVKHFDEVTYVVNINTSRRSIQHNDYQAVVNW